MEEGSTFISFSKCPRGSRDSCWGSCFASSKAFSPSSRAWDEMGKTKELSGNWLLSNLQHWESGSGAAQASEGDLNKLLCRTE